MTRAVSALLPLPGTPGTPGRGEFGNLVTSPTEEAPGTYETEEPSTNYLEYDEYGNAEETGVAFIAGESAVYEGHHYDHPTDPGTGDIGSWYDGLYQGLPAIDSVSDFPRWEGAARAGSVEDGGTTWLKDSTQMWWVSGTPSVTHSGTGAAGGDTATLKVTGKSTNALWLSMSGDLLHLGVIERRPRAAAVRIGAGR